MNVGRTRWFVFVASIWMLSTIDNINANIVETPVDTEVRVGDSTYLNCSISDASGEISWYHYPVGKGAHDLRYVYANKQVFEPYNKRFLIEKTASTGSFNLVITQAEVQDAGSYVCEDGRKSATSHLIILESTPECKSNINSNGFIGPNVCGLQKETIQLSCAINYTGNIAPLLQWTRVKQGNWFSVPESSCSVFNGRITCNYTTEAETRLDESVFICHSNRSRNPKDNCKTEAAKILYAFATDNQMEKAVGETVTCVANTNSVCSNYVWFYSDGVHPSVASRSQTLSLESAGWYRCEANCSIKSKQCAYNTMTVNVYTKTEMSRYNVAIALLSCFVAALIVTVLILVFYIRKLNRKQKKYEPFKRLANEEKEKPSLPKRQRRINPMNEHLLKCKTDPLVYIKKPKLMRKFNMIAGEHKAKAIHGITILKDMLYVVREDCKEIEVYSLTDYKYKESIKVEDMVSPDDIISHDDKNYLFIEDDKDGEKDQNEIIRVTPKEDASKKCRGLVIECRWPITDETKLRRDTGRLSLTHEGNILIPLMNEGRLLEYDCDGHLRREIEISTRDETYKLKHFRQAILLKSGYFVLSFGDGASLEKQGVFIAKMEGQKLKCIKDDSHLEAQKTIAKPEVTPLNKDNKNERSGSKVKIDLPSHTITLDDLSILVADRKNRRILLFHVETTTDKSGRPAKDASKDETRLKFQRELLSEKDGLNKPYRLHLDKRSGHLFVADNKKTRKDDVKIAEHGRILVYSVC